MKLCFIVKYPPIQGGTCATTFWLAYGLAERGHQVFVVTNADEVESDYRIQLSPEDRPWLEPTFEASGGFVRVFQTERFHPAKMQHIPCANPFVSKLAATATQVIRHYDCELIFAFYYEPYAVAGHLAAKWTGRPLVLRHAGSDLDRLMRVPGLATTYKEILKSADGVLTWYGLAHRFLGIGVAPENLFMGLVGGLRRETFNPGAPPLDLAAMAAKTAWTAPDDVEARAEEFDPARPTIGIYGKVGEPKGSYDLVKSLSRLRQEGLDFNFVALTQGQALPHFKNLVREQAAADRTWILPFVAHWRIPGFIRACTAVCFLERGFPIKIHSPKVATEILTCGTCLIVSGEIASKQNLRDELIDKHNALVVQDPRDHAELASALRYVIEDPERARAIGRRGPAALPDRDRYVESLEIAEAIFRRILGATTTTRSFKEKIEDEYRAAGGSTCRFPFGARMHDRLMPWLGRLFPKHLDDWQVRFFNGKDGSEIADKDVFSLACSFCDFVAVEVRKLVSPAHRSFVNDLLRFQKARLRTSFDRSEDSLLPFAAIDKGDGLQDAAKSALALRPLRSNYSSVEEFDWDVAAAFASGFRKLGADLATPNSQSADELGALASKSIADNASRYLFFKTQNLNGGVLKITKETGDLLNFCDGTRTTAEILDELSGRYGCSDVERHTTRVAVVQTLKTLYHHGAIVFA